MSYHAIIYYVSFIIAINLWMKISLLENLPKGMAKVTHCMTLTRLLRNGLTYSRLQSLFESAESTLDFYDKLKDIGVDRKAAKSMASHLASSGLTCRGAIEKDIRSKYEEPTSNEQRKLMSSL